MAPSAGPAPPPTSVAAPPRTVVQGVRGLMWLLLLVYVVALLAHGPARFEPLVDGWLCVVTQLLPAAVCWLALLSARPQRRPEIVLLAVAETAFALGNIPYVLAFAHGRALPVPSLADVGYLAFYPAALVALGLALRRQHRSSQLSVWVDASIGGLAAAAVIGVALGPAFHSSANGTLGHVVSLSFPVFDLLLIAAVVAVTALQGRDFSRWWLPLLTGFAVLAGADVVYDLRIAHGTYRVGTVLDATWAVGLTLLTLWAFSRHEPPPPVTEEAPALTLPLTGVAVALIVLVAGTSQDVPVAAIVLATLTVVASAGRTQLAFRRLRRLAELRRQAATDDLTGLLNRRAFAARAGSRLVSGRPAALLLLDLDRFKEVNDSLGHQVGDRLLVDVGARLAAQIEPGDLLGRLGGDEYAILLDDADQARGRVAAAAVRQVLSVPFEVGEFTLTTDASVGIALAPEHGTDLSQLLRRADIAMYTAKRERAGITVYSEADERAGAERLQLLQDLRVALAEEQFLLHFQPKVQLADGSVRGVEALVRWQHPHHGLLYPDRFLGLVEEAGLMPRLTEQVLASALDQARVWHEAGRPLSVAVNLPPSMLVDEDLIGIVTGGLAARRLLATALQLEITEDSLMADRARATLLLRRLHDLGVRISVDDFGTGYSSLAYLRELPIDELKLDRSFVSAMTDDARAAALVVSTISLAHSLGLRMVAEGVEDEASLIELTRHGCDEAQGYFLSRPVPAAQLDQWLMARQPSRVS